MLKRRNYKKIIRNLLISVFAILGILSFLIAVASQSYIDTINAEGLKELSEIPEISDYIYAVANFEMFMINNSKTIFYTSITFGMILIVIIIILIFTNKMEDKRQ